MACFTTGRHGGRDGGHGKWMSLLRGDEEKKEKKKKKYDKGKMDEKYRSEDSNVHACLCGRVSACDCRFICELMSAVLPNSSRFREFFNDT